MGTVDDAYFDALYAESGDPWALASRWYEIRKRALIMACLPARALGRVFEPACAGGELTAELARRASRVLATDSNPRALAQARQRLAACLNVTLALGRLPQDWPEGRFDLIVLSEIGYYFEPDDWRAVAARAVDALDEGGAILACHWRHAFDVRRQTAEAVHGAIGRHGELFLLADHVEHDFLLQVWTRRPQSVAAAEGLV
jgi:SAM-dependent methyltransferase